MPIFVHLADEKHAARIRKNGIKVAKNRQGVYGMPVLPHFFASHQWLRELKRNGAKTLVGVYFRMNADMEIAFGRYNEPLEKALLGEAIQAFMQAETPLGYQFIIPRKIEPHEILRIKPLSQNLGWRYYPESHADTPLCACPACLPRGTIKSRRLRDRLEPRIRLAPYPELITKLQRAEDLAEIEGLLWELAKKRRRADPMDLAFLLARPLPQVHQSLALALAAYRHKNTRVLLLQLLNNLDPEAREYAQDSWIRLYG